MSAYRVAVVADDASSAAGTAVIRIDGLREWPANATLRIVPIDDGAVPPRSEGWPWGDITPLRVVPTATGVDVVLSADVAGSPRLIPGTPISILVPAVPLEMEARWPSLTPTVRRRSVAVAMSAGQLMAAKAEREQAEKVIAARRLELAEFAVRPAPAAAPQVSSGVQSAAAASRSGETGQLARLLSLRRTDKPAADANAAQAGPDYPRPSPRATGGQLAPSDVTSRDMTSLGKTVPVAPAIFAAPYRRRRLPGLAGFVTGMATMAAGMLGYVNFAPTSWLPPALASTFSSPLTTDLLGIADLQAMFKDVAATSTQSPQRKSAAGVDVATALSLADHSLRGERTPAETEEAVFWLKRALAASFSGSDVGWALTQLGTIYATPGNTGHSYVKAHTIWQLAAAQGDPVAHCFLGALYEHGLGVQPNRKIALDHYRAADVLGACRSAKDAVARLSE